MHFPAYIICATPRSGSTLLCDLLAESGVAGWPESYFRVQDIGYWAELWGVGAPVAASDPKFNAAYLAAMWKAGTADTGVFGLRLMWESVGEAGERLNATRGNEADFVTQFERRFGSTLFVYLSRRDKDAQAVSLVRAEQSGLWHVASDGSERERSAPPRKPVFDATRIARARATLVADDARWASFFDQRGIVPVRLSYEDLAINPQANLATILAALGRDRTLAEAVRPRTAKMADATSIAWTKKMRPG